MSWLNNSCYKKFTGSKFDFSYSLQKSVTFKAKAGSLTSTTVKTGSLATCYIAFLQQLTVIMHLKNSASVRSFHNAQKKEGGHILCTYIYIHICMYVCAHMCVCMHVCAYICTCMFICFHAISLNVLKIINKGWYWEGITKIYQGHLTFVLNG